MPFWRKFFSTKKGCKNVTKKAKEQYFKSVSSNDMASNKQFWDDILGAYFD